MIPKLTATAVIIALTVAASCNSQTRPGTPGQAPGTAAVRKSAADNPVKWVSVDDMTENSFTIQMPDGWTNAALLHRKSNGPRSLVTSVSPDKGTVIYLSDPTLPVYALPNPQMQNMYRQMGMPDQYIYMNYVNADEYFADYIQRRFGNLKGFHIIKKFQNVELLEYMEAEKAKLTMPVRTTLASFSFAYESNGRKIVCEVNGSTAAVGDIWLPDVSGFCTVGDPGKAEEIMMKMIKSRKSNPQWQRDQDLKHQQTMAMIDQNTQRMTQQHQQNMANIQASAAAHQQRMANLHEANDAYNKSWSDNQRSQDIQHERVINSIREEHTVADQDGNTYQVDNKNSKYFVDKDHNTYIGAHGTTTLDDLRQIKSLNIDNFQEVQIIR